MLGFDTIQPLIAIHILYFTGDGHNIHYKPNDCEQWCVPPRSHSNPVPAGRLVRERWHVGYISQRGVRNPPRWERFPVQVVINMTYRFANHIINNNVVLTSNIERQ